MISSHEFISRAKALLCELAPFVTRGASRADKGVCTKKDGSLVTEIDNLVETRLVGELRAAFPEAVILGEEGGIDLGGQSACQMYDDFLRSQYQITIDPIDGTRNYINGHPQYCIAVALSARQQAGVWPIAGVIAVPEEGVLYWTDGECLATEQLSSGQIAGLTTGPSSKKQVSVNSRDRAWLAERGWELKVPWVSSGSSVYDFLGTLLGNNQASIVGAQRLWDLMAPLALASYAGLVLRDMVTGDHITALTINDLSHDIIARPWGLSRKMVLARPEVPISEIVQQLTK